MASHNYSHWEWVRSNLSRFNVYSTVLLSLLTVLYVNVSRAYLLTNCKYRPLDISFYCLVLRIIDSTYKSYHTVFVFPCLTSLRIISSKSIHVLANGTIFPWLNNIPLCVCVFIYTHIHLLVDSSVVTVS